jgi:peroxiredoxin
MNKINWVKTLVRSLPWLLIGFLAIEDVLLMSQNHRLRANITALVGDQSNATLEPGDRVKAIKVTTLLAKDSLITYKESGRKYLLFVLSPTCPHCERNLNPWAFIAQNASTSNFSAIGISIFPLAATKKYSEEKKIAFNLVIGSDTTFSRNYKVNSVPQTILLGFDGKVEKVWLGELSSTNLDEINELIATGRASL